MTQPPGVQSPQDPSHEQAARHVAGAHELLGRLREQLDNRHPELEEAITKLETALSLLTIKSGALL